jgi:hypothetical protein
MASNNNSRAVPLVARLAYLSDQKDSLAHVAP